MSGCGAEKLSKKPKQLPLT